MAINGETGKPIPMRESEISKTILIEASKLPGLRLFRNNVGLFYSRTGAPVRCGLAVGSPDFFGWRSILITPDMVGTYLAQAVGVEIKTDSGRERLEQVRFRKILNAMGGKSVVIRSPEALSTELSL